jgi:hypothetical protein
MRLRSISDRQTDRAKERPGERTKLIKRKEKKSSFLPFGCTPYTKERERETDRQTEKGNQLVCVYAYIYTERERERESAR